jgi:hypothetical protein
MPFLAVDRVVLGWVCRLFPKNTLIGRADEVIE